MFCVRTPSLFVVSRIHVVCPEACKGGQWDRAEEKESPRIWRRGNVEERLQREERKQEKEKKSENEIEKQNGTARKGQDATWP
jgi:hypothetical protein